MCITDFMHLISVIHIKYYLYDRKIIFSTAIQNFAKFIRHVLICVCTVLSQ